MVASRTYWRISIPWLSGPWGASAARRSVVAAVGDRAGASAPSAQARSVVDLHQIEPFRRRDRRTGGAIARRERGGEIIGAPASLAHECERTDHRAYLRVQERARRGADAHLFALAHHTEPI